MDRSRVIADKRLEVQLIRMMIGRLEKARNTRTLVTSTIHGPSHAVAGKTRIESENKKEYIMSNDREKERCSIRII